MSQNKQRSAVDYPNAGQLRRLVAIRQKRKWCGDWSFKTIKTQSSINVWRCESVWRWRGESKTGLVWSSTLLSLNVKGSLYLEPCDLGDGFVQSLSIVNSSKSSIQLGWWSNEAEGVIGPGMKQCFDALQSTILQFSSSTIGFKK